MSKTDFGILGAAIITALTSTCAIYFLIFAPQIDFETLGLSRFTACSLTFVSLLAISYGIISGRLQANKSDQNPLTQAANTATLLFLTVVAVGLLQQ
ncbi:MAG: hypothetical protein KC877_03675 [Candidatus Kaiserbacteria bacterium]|nr:hypothetical protein [Candidatus Kaiserbacteria bacterium]MCB9815991.1 hypothetical protein [Candidatus Nomurabacteria bacterium]